MSPKVVVVHVISKEEVDFYLRFIPSFVDLGLGVHFITSSLFCKLYLMYKGQKSFISFLKGVSDVGVYAGEGFNIKAGWLNNKQAKSAYYSMYRLVSDVFPTMDVKAVFIPSGRLVSQEAVAEYCKKSGIPIIFSGYGNFPGKTFFDPAGTDKASSLYSDINKLREYVDDQLLKEFEEWRYEFIAQKLNSHIVPQASKTSWKSYVSRFFRVVFCKVEKAIGVAIDIDKGFSSFKELSRVDYSFLDKPLPEADYIFLPLQYSSDAQLILNYSGDIETSMNEALKLAREKGVSLVIKPHPVDTSPRILALLESFVGENAEVSVSQANTFQIISKAALIVTVNSTVGLEAKIMGVEVIFLGHSFYKNMNMEDIGSYILRYLSPIDYFSKSTIPEKEVSLIMERCGVVLD